MGVNFLALYVSMMLDIGPQNVWTYSTYATSVHLDHSDYINYIASKLVSCHFHDSLQDYFFVIEGYFNFWVEPNPFKNHEFTFAHDL